MILARVIGMLGPIDMEMLENGQESLKYFTEEFDLYHINEVNILRLFTKNDFFIFTLSALQGFLSIQV